MNELTIELTQELDETGEPEEFTWHLFPLVDSAQTLHLDGQGLPKIGTHIAPGMIIIGRIGKTRAFDPSNLPNALEKHGLTFDQLRAKYGRMWKDSSLYAQPGTSGTVTRTEMRKVNNVLRARVWLKPEAQ